MNNIKGNTEKMVSYESIYAGSTYLLDPNYNFTGYRVKVSDIGGTTSIQTANQLSEVNKLLNQGIKTTELSIINPDVLEMIPKDHFKEIQRLNQLTGAESTIHAPIVDPSGFTEQGWGEENMKLAERQFNETIERAHVLNKNGNMPVTIHSSTIPGSLIMPDPENKGKDVIQRMVAVDQDTGQFIPLKREIKYLPGGPKKGQLRIPEQELKLANESYWRDQLYQVAVSKEGGDRLLRENFALIAGEDIGTEEGIKRLSPEQRAVLQQVRTANIYLENSYQSLNSIYNKAYKYADDDKTKKALELVSKNFGEEINKRGGMQHIITNRPDQFSQAIGNLIQNMEAITTHEEKDGIPIPKKYVQVEEFAVNKASETLSNVALNAYKKFGSNAPTVSIENPPYGQAISTGKDLKKLVEESKEKFVEKLTQEGKSRGEAQKIADKLIGVTWDTSHINMIRRQGYDRNRVVQEIKEVAPLVKHVHFNDNFGTTHTDLPPGMGDIPMSAVMQELEDAKFKGKKIFEGGNFVQHFQTTPIPYLIEHSGSPLYTSGGIPSWNQLGGLGNYYIGHGQINPAIHHSLYQSGFSTLPVELGGEIPGQQSRFAGTPNA